VLKNDPTLAFRLLRYINSPAFGLSVEISSFRHALMILGYRGSSAGWRCCWPRPARTRR
jgi:c-di-GMP-related signal transduction protein